VPTPPPEREPVNVGDKVNSTGGAAIVQTPTTPVPDPNTGTFTNLTAVAHYHIPPVNLDPGGNFAGPVTSASVVMNTGKVSEFESSGNVFKPTVNTAAGFFGSMATNDFIGWGNWAGATKNGATTLAELHYIVGQATPVLPTTVGVATYTLIGGSAPTSYTGTSGTLFNTSNLSVNFDPSGLGPQLTATINTSFGNISESVYFSSSSFTGSQVRGIFTGLNANRAGLIYNGNISPAGTFSGTAIFQAP